MSARRDAISATVPGRWDAARNGDDRPAGAEATPPAADVEASGTSLPEDLLRRVLQLEGEVRRLRALLDVRNEAFRALMARLVHVEMGAQVGVCEQLTRERDEAVALARALETSRLYRYTTWPRAAYGILLRVKRSLRSGGA